MPKAARHTVRRTFSNRRLAQGERLTHRYSHSSRRDPVGNIRRQRTVMPAQRTIRGLKQDRIESGAGLRSRAPPFPVSG